MAPRISTAVAALAAGCTALSATTRPLRIGTRGSPLALAQAYMTRQLLMDNFEELSSEGAIQLVRSCLTFLTSDCIMCNRRVPLAVHHEDAGRHDPGQGAAPAFLCFYEQFSRFPTCRR